jgi:hypothetical protein
MKVFTSALGMEQSVLFAHCCRHRPNMHADWGPQSVLAVHARKLSTFGHDTPAIAPQLPLVE